MDSEVILPVVASVGLAVSVAWVFPRFSRNFLGPAIIAIGVVAFLVILNQPELGRDAWGPAQGVVALFVGGVGIVAGLTLIFIGAAGSKHVQTHHSRSRLPYSRDKPYRMPGPGLFSPMRMLVAIIVIGLVVAVATGVYYWMA